MKINFEEKAIEILSANYPKLKFDLNVEHVNKESAMFIFDDENETEWKMDLEIVENEDAIDIIEWSIKERSADEQDWHEEMNGEEQI